MKKWISRNLLGFSLASFFNDFCHEMTTAILPTFINQITGNTFAPTALGLIQGIADAFSTIMKLISGFLADRVNKYKPFLIIGYGGITFVSLIGTATTVWTVVIYKSIAWMARGIREPMRDTWLSKITLPQFYGRAFGFHRAWDTLGALVGPLCAFILLQMNVSLRLIFFISFIPGIISVLPIIFLTKENPELKHASKPSSLLHQLKQLPVTFNYFLLVMLIFGLGSFNQALLIYRAQELLRNSSTFITATGWVILFYTVANCIRGLSEFGMGLLSDYISRKNLLALIGFGSMTITSVGCVTTNTHLWFWFLMFALGGLSAGTVKTLEKAYAADLLPEQVRGTGFGTLQAIDGIGDLCSSLMVGLLWTFFSAAIGFLFAATLSFMAMIMLLFSNKKRKHT